MEICIVSKPSGFLLDLLLTYLKIKFDLSNQIVNQSLKIKIDLYQLYQLNMSLEWTHKRDTHCVEFHN